MTRDCMRADSWGDSFSDIAQRYGIGQQRLLVKYPGASAAYSLRALTDTYVSNPLKPVLRVRRSGDGLEADAYDDEGTLKVVQGENLLKYSEEFDNTPNYWNPGNADITANATTAPDGSDTADELRDKNLGTSGSFNLVEGTSGKPTAAVGTQLCYSIYAKAGSVDRIAIQVVDYLAPAQTAYYLLTGAGSVTSDTGFDASGIEDVGGGWYRCWATFTVTTATGGRHRVYGAEADGDLTWTIRDATHYLHLWGAQVNTGSTPTAYETTYGTATTQTNPTLASWVGTQNLVPWSEEFTQTGAAGKWNPDTNTTQTANSTTDPLGGDTADTLVDTNPGTTGAVFTRLWSGLTVTAAGEWMASVYAKESGARYVYLTTENFTGGDNGTVYFDLNAGSVGTASGGVSGNITSVGSGWYRCDITFTVDGGDLVGNLRVGCTDTDGSTSILRDGTASIFVWGAQVHSGTTLLDYSPTRGTAAGDGYVTDWYDQMEWGSADITQATAASQPQIVSAGAVLTQDGMPAINFDGSNDYLKDSGVVGNIVGSENRLIMTVHATLGSSGTDYIYNLSSSSATGNTSRINGANTEAIMTSGVTSVGVTVPESLSIHSARSPADTTYTYRINGTDDGTPSAAQLQRGINAVIAGANTYATPINNWQGRLCELIIWPQVGQVANVAEIEAAIASYYGITI